MLFKAQQLGVQITPKVFEIEPQVVLQFHCKVIPSTYETILTIQQNHIFREERRQLIMHCIVI